MQISQANYVQKSPTDLLDVSEQNEWLLKPVIISSLDTIEKAMALVRAHMELISNVGIKEFLHVRKFSSKNTKEYSQAFNSAKELTFDTSNLALNDYNGLLKRELNSLAQEAQDVLTDARTKIIPKKIMPLLLLAVVISGIANVVLGHVMIGLLLPVGFAVWWRHVYEKEIIAIDAKAASLSERCKNFKNTPPSLSEATDFLDVDQEGHGILQPPLKLALDCIKARMLAISEQESQTSISSDVIHAANQSAEDAIRVLGFYEKIQSFGVLSMLVKGSVTTLGREAMDVISYHQAHKENKKQAIRITSICVIFGLANFILGNIPVAVVSTIAGPVFWHVSKQNAGTLKIKAVKISNSCTSLNQFVF